MTCLVCLQLADLCQSRWAVHLMGRYWWRSQPSSIIHSRAQRVSSYLDFIYFKIYNRAFFSILMLITLCSTQYDSLYQFCTWSIFLLLSWTSASNSYHLVAALITSDINSGLQINPNSDPACKRIFYAWPDVICSEASL